MARTVKHAKLDSATARNKLKRGRQPHWQELQPGNHLGYRRQKGEDTGRWILRRYLGDGNRYRVTPLGSADDAHKADGVNILSHEQATVKARAAIGTFTGGKIPNITVRQAFTRYVEWKEAEGQPVKDVESQGRAHILPKLGDQQVNRLTAEELRKWFKTMADSAAQRRPKAGKAQYRPEVENATAAEIDEAKRKRQSSANRVLNTLKAILNHAFDEKQVSSRDEWGRRLKPFRNVGKARVRYLSIAEVQRLLNSCEPDFKSLVTGALVTGARYGELGRLLVTDFHPDSGTIHIRKSKTGKERHIHLNEEGAAFFKSHCAGRAGSELMFAHAVPDRHNRSRPWKKSEQAEPMKAANLRAKLTPPIGFHGLRHTWASLAAMNGVPLIVVAENLGHKDTKMVEKHYGHLAKSYIADAIRAGAPNYGIQPDNKVVALR
jgi:integrase